MTQLASAPNVEDIERLRLALVERLNNHASDRILGAQLGTHLNAIFAPGSYKSWLNEGSQNLLAFTKTFLNGLISPTTQRQGNDFQFQIEGRLRQVNQSFNGALWKAFCTLRPMQAIHFEPKTSTLYLSPVGSNETTENPTIAHVSIDEHRTMCQTFANNLRSEGRNVPQLIDIANAFEPHSYVIWVATLKSKEGLFREWGKFRVERIKDLFAQRVAALTADEAIRTRLTSELEADYLSHHDTKPGQPTTQPTPTGVPTLVHRTTDHSTRQVLTRALEALDDTQIAKILVPLDVVLALLTQRKQ